MPEYHDSYDSRSRYTRRHDSSQRTHDDARVKSSTAGHSHTKYTEDRFDARRHHTSHLDPDVGRSTTSHRSSSRRRHLWPPCPFAEDELVSLRREVGGLARIRDVKSRNEVPCRGLVDQEQLIIDVRPAHERYPESDRGSSTAGIPTPPTSEDERARKVKRRPSRINTEFKDEVPEISRRAASPYAFTKQSKHSQTPSSSDHYLSPNIPPPTGTSRSDRSNVTSTSGSRPSSPRSDSARLNPSARSGKGISSASHSTRDSAINDSDHNHASQRARPSLSSKTNAANPSPHSSIVDFAASAPSTTSSRRADLDARERMDSRNTSSSTAKQNQDKARRPPHVSSASSVSGTHDSNIAHASNLHPTSLEGTARPRESNYSTSRGPSPTNMEASFTGTPPRSPRMSAELGSQNPSAAGSRVPSVSGSRPSSPLPRNSADSPRIPRSDLDWGAALAANAVNVANRTKVPSRLASSMRQESVPDLSRRRRDDAASAQPTSLPYPEDDSPFVPRVAMPSERDHQFFGTPSSIPPYVHDNKSSTPSSPSTGSFKTPTSPSRPGMHRGYTTSVLSPPSEVNKSSVGPPRRADSKPDTYATSSQVKKDLTAMLKKGVPPCARPEPVSGYDDWYTVIGASNLDFCPDCVDDIFERTIFRPSFRRAPPRSLNTKIQCVLGSPWNRIAWLLTLQQHRTDLNLLKDLTEIDLTADPCPGNHHTAGTWYGLRDPDGLFVRDFHVCQADMRKLERLLPTLSSLFVRLPPRASQEKRICAVRSEGNRFSAYLDALIATHETAKPSSSSSTSSSTSASSTTRKASNINPMPLIDLIEHKTRFRECSRDNMLLGAHWHIIPGIPSLTVCEDCFDSVVEPEIRAHGSGSSSSSSSSGSGSSSSNNSNNVAARFTRTPQLVSGEGTLGSSCQLYSRRMRKCFRRACADNDVKYLARKSAERHEQELRLQEKYRDILRRAKRLSATAEADNHHHAASHEEEERRLNKELSRISEEWKERWE